LRWFIFTVALLLDPAAAVLLPAATVEGKEHEQKSPIQELLKMTARIGTNMQRRDIAVKPGCPAMTGIAWS
jgi:hypothetical protein